MTTVQTQEVPFQERFKLFAGFDWASDHHDVVAVDSAGNVKLQTTFEDTAEGWASLREELAAIVGNDLTLVAVAIETRSGPVVERLLELGCCVYPVNPKAAERYRERKCPSGDKGDRLDAWSLGDALRTDGHAWQSLKADDPLTQELRILCRDEIALIQQRTALVVQLRAALREYYPAVLEAFDDWTSQSSWEFVEKFPTPSALAKAGKRHWEKFLHIHRMSRSDTYQQRMEIFARAEQFAGSPAVTSAKSRLALALTSQLHVLEKQLKKYRQAIEELFASHPDHDIFGSLPGAGDKLSPRLLSEFGSHRDRFEDPQAIQCYAGTAPITKQSGKNRWVQFRWGCNKFLRSTVHLWADHSRAKCVWAETYYQQKRKQGMSHACSLRCLGQRWLKILWKMWQTRTTYNEALHTSNQTKHGSWVLRLS